MTQTPKHHQIPCIQEERLEGIEKNVDTIEEKQEKNDVLLASMLTEMKYQKAILLAILGLAGAVAVELFKLL